MSTATSRPETKGEFLVREWVGERPAASELGAEIIAGIDAAIAAALDANNAKWHDSMQRILDDATGAARAAEREACAAKVRALLWPAERGGDFQYVTGWNNAVLKAAYELRGDNDEG
jgi:hypothetical protein